MLMSGELAKDKLSKLGGGVLGIKWESGADLMFVDLRVNLSHRKRGLATGPDVTIDT